MRVLLILPWHLTDRSYRSRFSTLLTYASTTLGTIAAIIENVRPDWSIDTIDEMSEKIDFGRQYDIVMITASTPTVRHAYDISETYRKQGTYVVMGGYHVKYMSEEALQYADSVIVGPGEYSIPEFIADYEAGTPKRIYDNNCVLGKDILSPDRSKISLKKYLKYPGVIANPSCPNHCAFCAISDLWRNAGARPVENVIEEIRSLKKKIIIFFDPNFFGNREYSIELMNALIPLKIRWAERALMMLHDSGKPSIISNDTESWLTGVSCWEWIMIPKKVLWIFPIK